MLNRESFGNYSLCIPLLFWSPFRSNRSILSPFFAWVSIWPKVEFLRFDCLFALNSGLSARRPSLFLPFQQAYFPTCIEAGCRWQATFLLWLQMQTVVVYYTQVSQVCRGQMANVLVSRTYACACSNSSVNFLFCLAPIASQNLLFHFRHLFH